LRLSPVSVGLGQAIAIMFAKRARRWPAISTTESKGWQTLRESRSAGGQALFRAGDMCELRADGTLIVDTVNSSAASIFGQ
jgi:hypothetical protein